MANKLKTYTFRLHHARMKKINPLLLSALLLNLFCYGQITVIGHTKLNNTKITNTEITVKEKDNGKVIRAFNTKSSSDFMVEVEFGKVYNIYFQNPKSPTMYLEVIANTIPPEKYEYLMDFEMDVPFVDRRDHDIDTMVFQEPFFKIIYDGKKRMIDDTAYNNAFIEKIIKKPALPAPPPKDEKTQEPVKIVPSTLAGKILLNDDLPAINKTLYLIDNQGKIIKTASTNRYGAFIFNNVMPEKVALLKMDVNEPGELNAMYKIVDTKKKTIANLKPANGSLSWEMKGDDVKSLEDNDYTENIGGKLVYSSTKEKKFFSEKTVYLSNKFHTVLKKTKTNVLGSFVFEDIKLDHDYFIGVDKADVPAGSKIDMLSKDDTYLETLDSLVAERYSLSINSSQSNKFNDMAVEDGEVKMGVQGTVYGDNVNTPIGKLKIVLLNDDYQVIDSVLTDNLGTFKFKYLPFLKRFFLSAENTDNMLDVFKNILIYSADNNLIKIMTHQKGTKFSYRPVEAEITRLRDIELDDPWLELIGNKNQQKTAAPVKSEETPALPDKYIVENILFENNKYEITPQSKEILDKIILVLKINTALKLEIGAHTDSKGSAASNMALSQMRAKTVREYIVNSGIAANRIISKGYGETKLKNNCRDEQPCSEAEHAQNRRIEFKILEE